MPEIPVKIRSNDNEREYQNFIIKVNSKELNATNQKRRGGGGLPREKPHKLRLNSRSRGYQQTIGEAGKKTAKP